jgi:uncharacterized repeat protein (TIGR01451 family)
MSASTLSAHSVSVRKGLLLVAALLLPVSLLLLWNQLALAGPPPAAPRAPSAPQQADLSITKSATLPLAWPGQPVTYALRFSNSGALSATDVTITDVVPSEVAVQAVLSAGIAITQSAGPPTYTWAVQGLAPGAGGVLTLVGVVSPDLGLGVAFTNVAHIAGLLGAVPAAHRSTAVLTTAYASLSVTKTVTPEPAVAGESVRYTVTVVNAGPAVATGVVLSDVMDPHTSLHGVDQTDSDDDLLGFGGGSYENTYWHDPRRNTTADEWVELLDPLAAWGVFTSRVMDAYNPVAWERLSWTPRRPYGKPLPDDNGVEAAYALGDVNMTHNRVLLHLDEAPGATSFADTSGNGLPVTCPAVVSETCPTAGAAGRYATALHFDGISDSVVISDPLDPARYAIALWVRPTAVTDTHFILRTDALTHYSHMLGIAQGRFVHYVDDGRPRVAMGTTAVQTDTWYHVVGTAESGGDIKLYVNGVREAKLDGIGQLWTGGDRYRLGALYGAVSTTHPFAGEIDEVAIFTRTLSAGEVRDHYLRGALHLAFEARSCDDPACAGEAFGPPVYSELDNPSLGLPEVALRGVPDNRYFQYRATFRTEAPPETPQLRRVHVEPAHYRVNTSQGTCAIFDARTFTCALGSLVAGGRVTLTMDAHVHPSTLGVITNAVTVTQAAPGDLYLPDNTAHATSTVVSRARLTVGKDDELDPVSPGTVITYGLHVHNHGPSTAYSVTLYDRLPAGLVGYAHGNGGWACDPSPVVTGAIVTCTQPSLSVGHHWDAVVITATAPLTTGVITNTAWLTLTTAATELYTTASLRVTETTLITPVTDLRIAKWATPDPVNPEATLTYTIGVTNTGPYTATGVVVTETLDAGLVGYPIPGDWVCGGPGDEIVCTFPLSLPAGAMASFHVTVTAPLTGLLRNHVVVRGAQFDPYLEDNEIYAYAAVRHVADLSLSKHDVPDPVYAGTPLTYTLVVTNAGPTSAGQLTERFVLNNRQRVYIPWGGRAQPYPSRLHLSSVAGRVEAITVTLNRLSHTYPGDLSVLLVGPGDRRVILMSSAGGGADADDVTLTFNDAGALMPLSGTLTSTVVYRPTNYGLMGDMPDPAPEGPYAGSLAAFRGQSPNGWWQLYVYDTVGSDGGAIAGGWTLDLRTVTTDTVVVTDTLPAGLTAVGVAAPEGWRCDRGSVPLACEADTLALHTSTSFTLTATAPVTSGVITNTAGIASTTADLGPGRNWDLVTTTVAPMADLSIAKVCTPALVTADRALTYTLAVSNAGPSAVTTTVVVTDILPADLRDVAVPPGPWMCHLTALPLVTCTLEGLAVGPAPDLLIQATAPTRTGVITNRAEVATALYDPDLLNNRVILTNTVGEQPIVGLRAFNNGPTILGNVTTLWATVAAGENVTYAWDLGDGTLGVGSPITHTYPATGTYTAVVTATNPRNAMTATTQVRVVAQPRLYLPLVMRTYAAAPDLVVESLIVTADAVTVTIANEGDGPVVTDVGNEFWVDVYIDPDVPPQQNDTWQYVGDQGYAWGITQDALPMAPGARLVLTMDSPYYRPDKSQITGTVPISTPVWAQVDSIHPDTTYGAVLEDHEISGLPYNNILGPIMSTEMRRFGR